MKALLDTHSFLWFIQDHPSLSPSARSFIESWENELFLSAASVWEMAIKISLGKLSVPSPFEGFIDEQCSINRFTW
jgi:PIN domain nuclease of toxin-antitoxin system